LRRLIALTLAVAACSGDRQASESAKPAASPRGTDGIALRVPRLGGTARAYVYPRLDSAVWAASGSPPVGRVLSFDPEAGLVAFTDDKGQPRRLDLRMSEVRSASKAKLTSVASANGNEIYGITATGSVTRMTPSGDWTFTPPSPAYAIFPQQNGSLVIAGPVGVSTRLWLIRPTDDNILDSASLSGVTKGARTQAGDRLFFTSRSGLVAVKTPDLSELKGIHLAGVVEAMAPTPSGDRVYVALHDSPKIVVLDRYSESVAGTIDLPSPATDLRTDPLGKLLLARPASGGDSAWVIDIGTGRLIGSVGTLWRTDLPAFAPSSTIATVQGPDVIFVDGATLNTVRKLAGGAKDYWYFFYWNGFRPRPADLDQPVTFGTPDTTLPRDTTPVQAPVDSNRPAPPLRDAHPTVLPPMVLPPPAATQRPSAGFLVSFAAVLSDQRAQEVAATVEVGGKRARVYPTKTGSTTIYRVVLGPFATREEADRIGRESKRQYWVFEAGS
jgi:cell division septation protein DedD